MIDEKTWEEYKLKGTRELKNQIVEDYLEYVGYIVNRVMISKPEGLMREDLFQFGILGLMDAIDKYDNERGKKFENFAYIKIYGRIRDEIRRHNASSGGPTRTMLMKMKKIENAIRTVENRLQRTADIEEIANELEWSLEEYYKALSDISISIPMSLDKMVGVDENLAAIEVIADEKSPQPEKDYSRKELIDFVIAEIPKLPPNEHRLIVSKYYNDLSNREIAYLLGVSEGRVSQLHTDIIIRLKRRLDEFTNSKRRV